MAKTSNPLGGRRGGGPVSPGRSRGGWFSFGTVGYILVCIVLFAAAVTWRAELGGALWTVLQPLEHVRMNVDASDNQRLRAELAQTTALVADRNALYQENLLLKARLNRDAGLTTILAGVIVRPPGIPYDTLVVDAGSIEGVVRGDLVSAGGTTLIGSVSEVYAHTSRVILFSAPGQTYDVLLRPSTSQGAGGSVPVSMQGQGSGSLVGEIPAGTPASAGDVLVFPGIASGFSGSVSRVVVKEGESFETIYARLPIDPLELQFVEIQKAHE